MKRILLILLAVFFTSGAMAEIIIIGDVDAPNTNQRPDNYVLLENVRNGGTDIAWLTGGYPVNSRYTDLRSRWTTAGATITDDLTTGVSIPLADRDLVVVSQLWSNVSLFDAAAQTAIGNYLAAGGEVLYIAQVSGTPERTSYNDFLTGIGSTMQFVDFTGGGALNIDTSTPYGQGVTNFILGGWTPLSGGIPVVSQGNDAGVAYGSGGDMAMVEPVPTMSFYALVIAALALLLVGGVALRSSRGSRIV